MPEIELQVHDSTHRKPILDGFDKPMLSLESKDDHPRAIIARDTSSDASAPLAPSRSQIKKARIQFITLCWTLFLAGWNDASTGPLLPRIQEVYHVTFLEGFR